MHDSEQLKQVLGALAEIKNTTGIDVGEIKKIISGVGYEKVIACLTKIIIFGLEFQKEFDLNAILKFFNHLRILMRAGKSCFDSGETKSQDDFLRIAAWMLSREFDDIFRDNLDLDNGLSERIGDYIKIIFDSVVLKLEEEKKDL